MTVLRLIFVLDCADPRALASFWTTALGYRSTGDGDPYVVLVPKRGRDAWPEILLQRVPEPKIVKNRMHLDFRVDDLDAEVERVVALGAIRLTDEPFDEDGYRWHILADPEGNEFCVVTEPPEAR